MAHKRRRGTAIVDTPNGILVVSEGARIYHLPGGVARKGESRRKAAIRELREETGLIAVDCSYLFEYTSHSNQHKVFLMKCTGTAEPKNEIKHLAYFDGSNVNVSDTTKKIIERYHGIRSALSLKRCEVCGRDDILPFKCNYCGKTLCSDHRLPESHNCTSLSEIPTLHPYAPDMKRRLAKWSEEDYDKSKNYRPIIPPETPYHPRKHKSKPQLLKRIIAFLLIIIFVGGLYHHRAFVIPTFLKFIGYEAPEIAPTVTPIQTPVTTPSQTPTSSPIPTPTSTPTITSQPNTTDIEVAIFIYTNIERRNHGVEELIWDEQLSEIARAHSRDMVQNDFFSHVNLEGEDPTARAKRYGYPLRKELGGGWYREGIAENIGAMPTGNVLGVGYVSNDADSIAKAQVESWMSSSGHRSNILDPSYNRLGVGVAYDGLYYISTQNFW